MRIGVLYAETVKLTSLGLIYGCLNPLAYLLTSLALGVSFFCTRIGIATW